MYVILTHRHTHTSKNMAYANMHAHTEMQKDWTAPHVRVWSSVTKAAVEAAVEFAAKNRRAPDSRCQRTEMSAQPGVVAQRLHLTVCAPPCNPGVVAAAAVVAAVELAAENRGSPDSCRHRAETPAQPGAVAQRVHPTVCAPSCNPGKRSALLVGIEE